MKHTALLVLLCGCRSLWPGNEDNYGKFLKDHPVEGLTVTFFEIQNGDAFLVEFPHGGAMLVDAGDGRMVESVLSYLRVRGIERIDVALVTHPHLDHYGGLETVLGQHEVGQFISNGRADTMEAWKRMETVLDRRGVARRVVRRGDVIDGFKDVSIEVIYPDEEAIEAASKGDENHGSIVLRMRYGETTFLLMGDAEGDEEERLMAMEGTVKADVLKLGHHASIGSGGREWIAAVAPRYAVCMGAGLANIPPFYPRPYPQLKARLKAAGASTYITESDGAVQVTSDGKRVRVSCFRDNFRTP